MWHKWTENIQVVFQITKSGFIRGITYKTINIFYVSSIHEAGTNYLVSAISDFSFKATLRRLNYY